jgi:EAL domain-containing protein (putative c-di-GMP-specific phosphodiesterase class I)
MVGVEALLRWKHPTKGYISPFRFISIAEKSGQILEIGSWVLNQACRDLSAWRKMGHKHLKVAINISVMQLHSQLFIQELQSYLEQYDLPANVIEIEITESVAMEDPANTIETLNRIKELGCNIAIDDFGTGYSSLAYLKNLPVNTLKLDRSFVKDIETDENDRAISKATISLSHSLGLTVVAEGVETLFQKDFLCSLDCDYLQGYLFSKPAPFEKIVFDTN